MAILAVVDKKWPAEHVRRYVSPVRESGITCSCLLVGGGPRERSRKAIWLSTLRL